MTTLMWCEARCQGLYDEDYTGGCRETSNGAFGVKNATKSAHGQGWRIVDGDWLCPVCAKRREELQDDQR